MQKRGTVTKMIVSFQEEKKGKTQDPCTSMIQRLTFAVARSQIRLTFGPRN